MKIARFLPFLGLRLSGALVAPLVAAIHARRGAASQPWVIKAICAALRLRPSAARRIYRKGIEAELRFVLEYAWLATASQAQVNRALDRVSIEGLDRLGPVDASGKPVILLSIHMGPFYLGFLKLAREVNAKREINVIKMAPASAQEAALHAHVEGKFGRIRSLRFDDDTGKQAYLALRRGGVVALMSDVEVRVAAREPVQLFGREVYLQSGVARLAATTGAIIVPLINFTTPDGRHVMRIDEPLHPRLQGESPQASVARLMQEVATRMEDWIQIDPTQCHSWTHLAWTMHQDLDGKLDRRDSIARGRGVDASTATAAS